MGFLSFLRPDQKSENQEPKFKPNVAWYMAMLGLTLLAACSKLPPGHPDTPSDAPVILNVSETKTVLTKQNDIDPRLFAKLETIYPNLMRAQCLDEDKPFYKDSANFCTVQLYDKSNQLIDTLSLPRVLPEIPADELQYAKDFLQWAGYEKTEEDILAQTVRMSTEEIFDKYKGFGVVFAGRYSGGPLDILEYSPQDTPGHTKILLSHEFGHALVIENSTAETFVFRDPEDPSIFNVIGSSLYIERYHVETDGEGNITGLTSNHVATAELFAVWMSHAFAERQGLGEDSRTYHQYSLGAGDFVEEEQKERQIMSTQFNNDTLRPIWIKAMLTNPKMLLQMIAQAHAGAEYDEEKAVQQGFSLLTIMAERIKIEDGNFDYFGGEYTPFTAQLRDEMWVENQKALYGDATAIPLLGVNFESVADTEAFQSFLKRLYNFSTNSNRTEN